MSDTTARNLNRQSEAAAHLLASLSDDDAVLMHDTVEGETSFLEAIEAAINEMDECEIMIDGCLAKEKQISERRTRLQNRLKNVRGLIEQAINTSGLPTVKVPTATLTIKNVAPKYLIEDEAKIPSKFWKTPEPTLDRKSLGEAFKNDEDIPGVGQDNGGISLQIRRN